MEKLQYLFKKVEKERQLLYHLAGKYGLTHKVTLDQSRIIGKLLNQINQIKIGEI